MLWTSKLGCSSVLIIFTANLIFAERAIYCIVRVNTFILYYGQTNTLA